MSSVSTAPTSAPAAPATSAPTRQSKIGNRQRTVYFDPIPAARPGESASVVFTFRPTADKDGPSYDSKARVCSTFDGLTGTEPPRVLQGKLLSIAEDIQLLIEDDKFDPRRHWTLRTRMSEASSGSNALSMIQ